MKNLFTTLSFFLSYAVITAQTVVQPSSAPVSEPEKSNGWDVIAIIAGGIILSALVSYLIFLLATRRTQTMKRKLK